MKRSYILFALIIGAVLTLGFSSCAGDAEPGDDSWDYYDISEAAEELAAQLIKSYEDTYEARTAEKPPVKRLAILETVDQNGETTDIGKEMSSSLQSKLFEPKMFSLLEREQISGLLAEYTFNQSGMVEELTAAELGKLLGAEIVVVCSYTVEEDEEWDEQRHRISARIVDLETGEIFAIGRAVYVVENW